MQVTYYGYNALKYISLGSIGAGILAILFSIFNTSSWLLMLGLVFGAMFVFSGIYFYYALGWCVDPYKLRQFYKTFLDEVAAIWDGYGRVLDIGTGLGPIAIKIAKRFPNAQVYGVDTWSKGWLFMGISKAGAQKNAIVENVHQRCTFQHGSALNLPFRDGKFKVVVSALTFHEIRVPDRKVLFREAIRVLAPGGILLVCDPIGGPFLDTYKVNHINELLKEIEKFRMKEVKHKSLKDAGLNLGGLSEIFEFKEEAIPYREIPHHSLESAQLAYVSGKKL